MTDARAVGPAGKHSNAFHNGAYGQGQEMTESKKWRRFEDLVASVQRAFAQNAEVSTNVKVRGKDSGTERQIDIAVRKKVGQFDLFIAIDCKDYSEKVDVKDVETVMGLVADVGANQGAIVAAK